jgi:hypothetical protein
MPKSARAEKWSGSGISEATWFLWERNFPPPTHGFYGVIMANGEEDAALFDRRGVWWSFKMEKIAPMFWRDSAKLHRSCSLRSV